ncbi:MAG: F0F1 ATP synthase subunit epsilon [Legionellales bacterium]|nr:F0F1 ATP synthase subunit epsilon [Legionellales bacterium]
MNTIELHIVSAEESIFHGRVQAVFVTGSQGELGVYPGHTPLLTTLKPGQVRALKENNQEEVFYISGGLLEIQPSEVNVLADTAMRAGDIDEAAALEAKNQAERALLDQKSKMDYTRAAAELAEAVAQLRAIRKLKNK